AAYPHYIGDEFAPWRALRITELLAAGHGFTADDMRAIQTDIVNTRARHMAPVLTAAVENRLRNVLQAEPAETAALDLLQRWDFVERTDAPEPFIWHLWLQELERIAVQERLGFELDDNLLLDHLLLSMRRSELEEVATRAFRDAVRRAVSLQGDEPARWQWGRWHRMTVYHPVGESVSVLGGLFNVGDWPLPGSADTPYNASFDAETGLVNHGASWRVVVDLSTGSGRRRRRAPARQLGPRPQPPLQRPGRNVAGRPAVRAAVAARAVPARAASAAAASIAVKERQPLEAGGRSRKQGEATGNRRKE